MTPFGLVTLFVQAALIFDTEEVRGRRRAAEISLG